MENPIYQLRGAATGRWAAEETAAWAPLGVGGSLCCAKHHSGLRDALCQVGKTFFYGILNVLDFKSNKTALS